MSADEVVEACIAELEVRLRSTDGPNRSRYAQEFRDGIRDAILVLRLVVKPSLTSTEASS